jgi:hypothetical protein
LIETCSTAPLPWRHVSIPAKRWRKKKRPVWAAFLLVRQERNVSALNAFAERFSRGPASQVLHE